MSPGGQWAEMARPLCSWLHQPLGLAACKGGPCSWGPPPPPQFPPDTHLGFPVFPPLPQQPPPNLPSPQKQGSPGDISWLLAPGSLIPVWHLLLLPLPPAPRPWLALEVPRSCWGQLLANVTYLVLSQMLWVPLRWSCIPGVPPNPVICPHRGLSVPDHPWQAGVSSRCWPWSPGSPPVTPVLIAVPWPLFEGICCSRSLRSGLLLSPV